MLNKYYEAIKSFHFALDLNNSLEEIERLNPLIIKKNLLKEFD